MLWRWEKMTEDLDVQVEVAEVPVAVAVELSENELLAEFARVMHEWDFAPFRRGEVRLPTLAEARRSAARYPARR